MFQHRGKLHSTFRKEEEGYSDRETMLRNPTPQSSSMSVERVDQGNELLPPGCEGPKMHPYNAHNPKIIFEERLGEYDASGSGGAEGYVFKVRINSQPFALKMFKFFDALEERNKFSDIQNQQIADADFEGHIDPFYAECRAYGRINEFYHDNIPKKYEKVIQEFSGEKPKRRKWNIVAAQCYGYLHLSAEHEDCLRETHGVVHWNRQEKDARKPIRALVKQLIETKDPVDKGERPNIRRMRDHLWTLHGIGIYPRDVFPRNYRGGLLLDFGRSFTVPHCAMEVLPRWQLVREIDYDMEAFDMMIDEQGFKTSIRAVRRNRNVRTLSETGCGSTQELCESDELGKDGRPA